MSMDINFNQLAMLQQLKAGIDRFRINHPKFPMFLRAVSQEALKEGSLIEINVTTPDEKTYCTNVRLKPDDIEFIESLKNMNTMQP